ncbi:NAD(P)/FAD-dependent oxidoreductase [Paenibacillus sp. KN14-4R]|uniref:NAD(P)/FAD-dependent oxidoreductase n=1 Tax=Paenibacillus sp. KN14-4R TaxID=3445773 RepID=UPI003FA1444E
MVDTKIWDVVIVGGGPAGLSAALVLGRSMRDVLVIDEGKPRNAVTKETHGFLTRDGIKPLAFKKLAMDELKRYETVQILQDRAENAERSESIFTVRTRGGEVVSCQKLIIATGAKDHLPKIEGLQEAYGTSVFPCPYCDGYEHRGEQVAIIGNGKGLGHYVPLIHHWSRDVIVFTNGAAEIGDELRRQMAARQIGLVEEPIYKLDVASGQLRGVVLMSNEVIARTCGYLMDTGVEQATNIPEQLGVKPEENCHYDTDNKGMTKVEGLYVIGDAKNLFTGLICSAAEGYEAGEDINQSFIDEAWGKEGE